jgi:hypothetical protein
VRLYLPFLGLLKIEQRLFLLARFVLDVVRVEGVCLGHHRYWERVMISTGHGVVCRVYWDLIQMNRATDPGEYQQRCLHRLERKTCT